MHNITLSVSVKLCEIFRPETGVVFVQFAFLNYSDVLILRIKFAGDQVIIVKTLIAFLVGVADRLGRLFLKVIQTHCFCFLTALLLLTPSIT